MAIIDTKELERALKSIGKKSFIEDYEVYSNQNLTFTRKIEILSEKYSTNGATIRLSFARNIFKHGKQREAITLVIDSPRISSDVKVQANNLLDTEC